jgi:HTH-type transcriptional regulator / antitoxin HigA
MIAATATRRLVPPTYFKLVRAFPLRNIRSDELDAALAVAADLMARELDDGGKDDLDALADIIEKYERAAHPIPDAPAADVLRLLMESNRLSQPQLAKAVAIAQSTLSAVLTGARALTADHIVKLARFFKVSPTVFLPCA